VGLNKNNGLRHEAGRRLHWTRTIGALNWVYFDDGKQGQIEAVELVQDAMQGGLIREQAGNDGLPAVGPGQREAVKPLRPGRVQVILDADLVIITLAMGGLNTSV